MLDILQKAAREAGDVLLKYFQKGVSASYKTSHKDLLTEADLASQKIICRTILKEMTSRNYKGNEIGFIAEEQLKIKGKHQFIIDPLDGTNNFASGIDYFCISIAYAKDRKITAGMIYHPTKDVYYFAQKHKGSYKVIVGKDIRLKLSSLDLNLNQSIMTMIFSYKREIYQKEIKIVKKIYPHLRGLRSFHSAALDICMCATNIFQISTFGTTKIWDLAAGKLIIEEAGGIMTDWSGNAINFDFDQLDKIYPTIVTHPKILPEVLKFF